MSVLSAAAVLPGDCSSLEVAGRAGRAWLVPAGGMLLVSVACIALPCRLPSLLGCMREQAVAPSQELWVEALLSGFLSPA